MIETIKRSDMVKAIEDLIGQKVASPGGKAIVRSVTITRDGIDVDWFDIITTDDGHGYQANRTTHIPAVEA